MAGPYPGRVTTDAAGRAGSAAAVRLLPLANFTSTFDRFSVPPLLLVIAAEFQVSLARVTAAATLYFLAYGLSQPFWGLVSDRLGRVRTIRVTLAAAGAIGLASAAAPGIGWLVAARTLQGALFAGTIPTAIVYMGDAFPADQRQRPLSRLFTGSALAIASASPVAGLVADLASWRLAFVLPALLALGLAVGLRRVPDPPRAGPAPSPLAGLRAVVRNRWALAVLGLALAEGACVLGLVTFLAPALQDRGLGPAVAGLASAAYGAGSLAGSRSVAALAGRLAPRTMMAAGAGLVVVGQVVPATGVSFAAIAAAGLLVGAGFALLHTNLQVWATDVNPAARAATISLFAASLFAGSAAGTALLAPLADAGRFPLLFALAAALALPTGIAATVGRTRYDRRR